MNNPQVPFVLNFFSGEDFSNQQDTLVELPTTLFELVTQSTADSASELWDILIDEDELPDFYTVLLEEVMDMDDDPEHLYFNGGVVRYEHGNNLLIIAVDPIVVRGVCDIEKRPALYANALMLDLGNYMVSVKFYVIDPDPEEMDVSEVDPEENQPSPTKED